MIKETMSFDYSKLIGRIKDTYKTQEKFADKLGISRASLNLRLNGKCDFSQKEIKKAAVLLGLTKKQTYEYFFTLKVRENELKIS